MPATQKHNRPSMWGKDCVFAITDFNGFMGALAQNYAAITGTITEVRTQGGTGIQVGVANSYVDIDLAKIPVATQDSCVFVAFYHPQVVLASKTYVSWGAAGADARRIVSVFDTDVQSGLDGNVSSVTGVDVGWHTMACRIDGAGTECYAYLDGVEGANNAFGGASTTLTALRLFSLSGAAASSADIGAIIQAIIVFDGIRSAADILRLHNLFMGKS